MISKIKNLIGLLFLIFVWYLISNSGLLDTASGKLSFANIYEVIEAIKTIFVGDVVGNKPENLWIVWATFKRVIVSGLIVLVLGTLIGIVLGYFKGLYDFVETILDFWRSIPPILAIPIIFAFFFGDNENLAIIGVVMFGCLPILIMQVSESIRNIPSERLEFADSIGAGVFFKFRHILWYEIIPSLFIGFRTVFSFSVIIVVVVEMVRGAIGGGVGVKIQDNNISRSKFD